MRLGTVAASCMLQLGPPVRERPTVIIMKRLVSSERGVLGDKRATASHAARVSMVDDGRLGSAPVGSAQGTSCQPHADAPDAGTFRPVLDPNRADVLAAVARDLAAPAAAFARLIRTLRRSGSAPIALRRGALDAWERQAHRLARTAEILARIDGIEAGRVKPRSRPTELREAVLGVIEDRRQTALARDVEIARELPAHPLTLSADPELMTELVGGLVDSALRRAGPGGRIRVSLDASARGAILAIQADARRPELPRSRSSAQAVELALWTALAQLQGADLVISSRGAATRASLEICAEAPAHLPDLPRASAPGRARVLVADDDEDARETLALVLEDYEVLLAADGREATEMALRAHPDLVLMDLYMPRMDGLTALQALRADPLTANLPVILISARGDDLTRSRSLDLGAVDFLQKPFSARELKARIERTLRLTRRETQLRELARTDPLTGLANLRAFRARLEEEVKRARRYRTPLACVMVDMDHLKPINDELGHAAGDIAIGAVAEVIRHELRETDFGARYGGDEFVMLLPHTTADEACVLAERLCARLRNAEIEVSGRRLPITASFGIAALSDESLDDPGEALVRRADAALYAAKRAGRGRVASHAASGDATFPGP